MEITQELVKKLFYYDNGILIRKNGVIPGCICKRGYHRIKIFGKAVPTHRLIFLYHNGYLPEIVDHKDTNKLNNKIENLREANRSQNNHNCKIRKDNTSGVKGVSFHKKTKKWEVKINLNGIRKYFGLYNSLKEAEEVSNSKRLELHKEFSNNGN